MKDMVTDREITALDLGLAFLDHYRYPYLVMHRGDLLNVEVAACRASGRVTLETNKEVEHVEDLPEGARHLHRRHSV